MTGDHDRDGGETPQGERDDRPELDVDSAFAAIVAGMRDEPAGLVGPWPAAEDVGDDDEVRAEEPVEANQVVLAGPAQGVLGRQDEVLDDDEGGYVPPDPGPIPRGDLVSRLAWAGVIGGPLFLLIATLVRQDLPRTLLLAALAAFVGGFVALVARMPTDQPDDPDDGAVV